MPVIRDFQERDGIWVFDSHLDERISNYDARHLEELFQAEERHFWFLRRRDKICAIFDRYVSLSAKVLEIGGGTGFIAAALKHLGFCIEMGDIHLYGLQQAKNKGVSKLYQFDLLEPPFQEEFDVICLFDVLEHLSDPLKALGCIKKMLKNDGMLILSVPAHPWLWSREDVIAGHQLRFTKKSLCQLIESAGFKPVDIRYFFTALLPFLLLRRWIKPDDGSALRKEEVLQLKISSSWNRFFDWITRSEWFLESVAGGSILAVASSHKTR